ncbi:MAG: prepilin-type N-terminal cleavage/methylation domain-containing protein, partial [Gammaproteobacteria bacterium]|nr:prepilin-type N-terminal cleavage/methylation domain-containing protein [Gammaproteobacteria bacterium]
MRMKTRKIPGRRRTRGFTLLEILIVVLIIG